MKKKKNIKIILLLLVPLLVGVTIAYLIATASKTNSFTVGNVEASVSKTYSSQTKETTNVRVQNTGNVDSYIRLSIVYSKRLSDGTIIGEEPVLGTDYTVTLSSSSKWLLSQDGYYYYTDRVSPNGYTDNIIDSFRSLLTGDEDLYLQVVAEAIQADPSRAVSEAWVNTTVTNGSLSLIR